MKKVRQCPVNQPTLSNCVCSLDNFRIRCTKIRRLGFNDRDQVVNRNEVTYWFRNPFPGKEHN